MSKVELTADIIRERMDKTSDYPYLGRGYQDWLGKIGLVKRTPEDSHVWPELTRIRLKLEQQRSLQDPQALFLMLMQEKGYLVSNTRLATVLYNIRVDGGVSPYDLENVKQDFYRLSNKIQCFHEALFSSCGMRSIGISGLAIRPSELKILHALWKNDGQPLSSGALADVDRGYNVKQCVTGIREALKRNNTGIAIMSSWGEGYWLIEERGEGDNFRD